MVKGLETFKFKPAAFQRMHLNCLPASLSVHHLVNIMILSIALRSLCPLVISPGFLIHSFMSSVRPVPGRSLIGLSDPLLPPISECFRSVRGIHPKARTLAWSGAGSFSRAWMFICRPRPLCLYVHTQVSCEDPVVFLTGEPI